jgi:hypothetical protein
MRHTRGRGVTEGPEVRPGSNSERECPLWVASGHFGRWAMKPRLVFGLKPRGAHTLKRVPSEWRLVEAGFVPKLCLTQAHCNEFQRTPAHDAIGTFSCCG